MTTPPPSPPPQWVWRKLSLGRLRWVALLVALAGTAVFGGLDAVDQVTPLSMGQSYDDGPLRITARTAEITETVKGMPTLAPDCRYLTLDVAIENVADRSVPMPTAMPVAGAPSDCTLPQKQNGTRLVEIHGVPVSFKGAIRLRDGQPMPTVEPGFTTEYRLVWAVPAADLAEQPQISARMPRLTEFISTYRITESWAGDRKVYGDLPLTSLGLG